MPTAFKDQFFSSEFVQQLSLSISDVYPNFNKSQFFLDVLQDGWEAKELKERMRHITICMGAHLPTDFKQAINILTKAVEQTQGAGNMVFPDYVEFYGLQHWDVSMRALEKFTQHGSSEFAIRPFLLQQPETGMKQMLKWSKHTNEHVRRLASEGCRPRLPWAMALPVFKKDPTSVLAVLENLKNDSSEYVRRSVANNLNDISKDNPDTVLGITKQWKGKNATTDKLIKHALRTLLKAGNSEALQLFGFAPPEQVQVANFCATPNLITVGDGVTLSAQLTNGTDNDLKVRLEFRIHFIKKNGKPSPKIFQWSERIYSSGEHIIQKKHSFQDRSIRKHYPGKHQIDIVVNGVTKESVFIQLNE